MSFSSRQRFRIFERDSFTCRYCGRKSPDVILQVDHVFPRAKGGTDDLENLITACEECNIGKNDLKLTVDNDAQTKLIMTPKETADFLSISQRTLDYLIAAREIPFTRISKKTLRFNRTELIGWMRKAK